LILLFDRILLLAAPAYHRGRVILPISIDALLIVIRVLRITGPTSRIARRVGRLWALIGWLLVLAGAIVLIAQIRGVSTPYSQTSRPQHRVQKTLAETQSVGRQDQRYNNYSHSEHSSSSSGLNLTD
jgi:hypothetical protein